MTNFPEDTVLYFTNFGPIRYIDDDDNTTGFLDWQGVLKAAEEAKVSAPGDWQGVCGESPLR